MKTVYICSPLRRDEKCFQMVNRYTAYALMCGTAPVVPHFFANCVDYDSPVEKNMCFLAGLQLMDMCDEIWVFGSNLTSDMSREIDYAARKLRIPVIRISPKYVEDYLDMNGR